MDSTTSRGELNPGSNGHKDKPERIAEIENQLSAVPKALKDRPRWMVWKSVQRGNGKPTKIPVDPHTLKNGSSVDPDKWSTYETAVEVYARNPWLAGVAISVTEDDPDACIDLDGCRDPETGEIDGRILKIVERLDTYTEVS